MNLLLGKAAFIDVETTGLSPLRDEIIELGLVVFAFRYDTGEVLDVVYEYTSFNEPSRSIRSSASLVHGITDRMVRGCKVDEEKVRSALMGSDFIIAHNANFDYQFVVRLFPWATSLIWMCSMRHIDWARHGFPNKGLQFLVRVHGVEVLERHRAHADCVAGVSLLGTRNEYGEFYLRELLRHLS